MKSYSGCGGIYESKQRANLFRLEFQEVITEKKQKDSYKQI